MENLKSSEQMTSSMIKAIEAGRIEKSRLNKLEINAGNSIQQLQNKNLTFEQMVEVLEHAKKRVEQMIYLRDRDESDFIPVQEIKINID